MSVPEQRLGCVGQARGLRLLGASGLSVRMRLRHVMANRAADNRACDAMVLASEHSACGGSGKMTMRQGGLCGQQQCSCNTDREQTLGHLFPPRRGDENAPGSRNEVLETNRGCSALLLVGAARVSEATSFRRGGQRRGVRTRAATVGLA